MKKNNHFSIDIIKLNHCLNAAKFTIGHLSKERKKLAEKIKKKEISLPHLQRLIF